MGVVSQLLDTAKTQLNTAAESQFGAMSGAIGSTIQVGATLAIILAFLNQIFQLRPMEITQFAWLVIKLILIHQFATVWNQFDAFASAIIDGMDSLAGAILSGEGNGSSLAEAFDEMLSDLGTSANTTLDNLNMFAHAIMSVVFVVLQSLVAASAGLVLIFALVMITLHIGLAPLFIGLSMFTATKDFFFKWLQSTITYALYPVVIAGVLGTIISLTTGVIDSVDTNNIQSIAALIPFIVILIIMIATILLIPTIVAGLSGAISAAGPLASVAVARSMGRNIGGAAHGARSVGNAGRAVTSAATSKVKEYGQLTGSAVRQWSANAVNRQIQRANKYRN